MGPEAMILDFLIFSLYREKQGIGRVGTREKHMEEVDMKVVHIKTIGEGRAEGWENRCQRDRKGGNDGSH